MVIAVFGKISAEDVLSALQKAFPKRSFAITDQADADLLALEDSNSPQTVVAKLDKSEVFPVDSQHALKKSLEKSEASLKAARKQHDEVLEEFVSLRNKYDDVKGSLVTILWSHCAKHHPDLAHIPPMESESDFTETETQVGDLSVGSLLGEGQFACVYNCKKKGDNTHTAYALKVISKDRISSFKSLSRISNEVAHLQELKSPYIVSVMQVHHTSHKLYILTEKGGMDLFDFFDDHPDGVSDKDTKLIFASVLKGVMFCHEHGVCHRDLKPENILLTYNERDGKCSNVKLCDFGLSTKFTHETLLTDFCGSPGFFAPEMITHGAYYGDKADVWSLGCILLELVLGHEKFCDVWMTSYDYDILQDRQVFTQSMQDTVDGLSSALASSNDLHDFVVNFLQLHSSRRSAVKDICSHAWLEHLMADEVAEMNNRRTAQMQQCVSPVAMTRMKRVDSISTMDLSDVVGNQDPHVNRERLKMAYNNMSEKERKHMEDYILHQRQRREESAGTGETVPPEMHLPPIEPQTPNLGAKSNPNRKKFFETSSPSPSSNDLLAMSPPSDQFLSMRMTTSSTPPPQKKHVSNLAVVAELSGEDRTYTSSSVPNSIIKGSVSRSPRGSGSSPANGESRSSTNAASPRDPTPPNRLQSLYSASSSPAGEGIAAFSPEKGRGGGDNSSTNYSGASDDVTIGLPKRLSGSLAGVANNSPSRHPSGKVTNPDQQAPRRPSGMVNSVSDSSIFSADDK